MYTHLNLNGDYFLVAFFIFWKICIIPSLFDFVWEMIALFYFPLEHNFYITTVNRKMKKDTSLEVFNRSCMVFESMHFVWNMVVFVEKHGYFISTEMLYMRLSSRTQIIFLVYQKTNSSIVVIVGKVRQFILLHSRWL